MTSDAATAQQCRQRKERKVDAQMIPEADYIIECFVTEGLRVQKLIQEALWKDPDLCMEPMTLHHQGKMAARIDVLADEALKSGLERRLKAFNPAIMGEESLRSRASTLRARSSLAILHDGLDGTRLLAYGRSVYCS
jgi:hypothetical protein